MNVPISARDARRSKKASAASSSTAAPSGPPNDPEVEVVGERPQADIPVVNVEEEAAPAATGKVQGNQAHGSAPATSTGQADDQAETSASLKKRKASAGRKEGRSEEEEVPLEGELIRKKKKKSRGDGGNGPEPPVAQGGPETVPEAGGAQGDKGENPAGNNSAARTRGGLVRARGGDPGASSSKPKKKYYVNFHYNQNHLLCDDFYSSAGLLRQLTVEGHELPKVPELTESDWYRCMASTIAGVSLIVFL